MYRFLDVQLLNIYNLNQLHYRLIKIKFNKNEVCFSINRELLEIQSWFFLLQNVYDSI